MTKIQKSEFENLLAKAVLTDGGHHKQWYLEIIAEVLRIKLPDHEKGVTP